eukprot:Pgem_evm1s14840
MNFFRHSDNFSTFCTFVEEGVEQDYKKQLSNIIAAKLGKPTPHNTLRISRRQS